MSTSAIRPEAYLLAEDVVHKVCEDLAIDYQVNGASWDRDAVMKNFTSRHILLKTREILMAEAERANGTEGS